MNKAVNVPEDSFSQKKTQLVSTKLYTESKKVQAGNDQEKVQSERNSHSKSKWEKNKSDTQSFQSFLSLVVKT